METKTITTAGVPVWTPAPARPASPTSSEISREDVWGDEDDGQAEGDEDFDSQMDENGIIGLPEAPDSLDQGENHCETDSNYDPSLNLEPSTPEGAALDSLDQGENHYETDSNYDPSLNLEPSTPEQAALESLDQGENHYETDSNYDPSLNREPFTPEEEDPSGHERETSAEETSCSTEPPGDRVPPRVDLMGDLEAQTADEEMRPGIAFVTHSDNYSHTTEEEEDGGEAGQRSNTDRSPESPISQGEIETIRSTQSSSAMEPVEVDEIAATIPGIQAETISDMSFTESLQESHTGHASFQSIPRCPEINAGNTGQLVSTFSEEFVSDDHSEVSNGPSKRSVKVKHQEEPSPSPPTVSSDPLQVTSHTQSPNREARAHRARSAAADVEESRKPPLTFRTPDFSKVSPRVHFPKGGYMPPKSRHPAERPSLFSEAPLMFKSPADIVKEVLLSHTARPDRHRPQTSAPPTSNVPQEFWCQRQATTLLEQLQEDYNRLLTKYAEAENTIDRLRLEAKVTLYSDLPEPRHCIQSVIQQQASRVMMLDFPRAQRAEITPAPPHPIAHSTPQRTPPRKSPVPPVRQQLAEILHNQAEEFLQQVQIFEGLLKSKRLRPSEQMKGLSQLAEGLVSLENNYMLARDKEKLFDPERELEGFIFQCGLHMDELKEQVEQMSREATPSPLPHPTRPSDPSKGALTPTHPQITPKTPPEPQLVDPVQTGPVKGSSARGETDGEEEETLRSPLHDGLSDKHRLVEQDSTTDQESDHQDSVTSKQWSSMSSPPTPRASSQPSTLPVHGPSSKTVQGGQSHSSSLTETTGSGPNKLPTRTHSGHPARPSDPSKGAPTPTHPQILTKTPPEPQLVDPVQTGPVKGSSARGETDGEEEETLRSPLHDGLSNKHRLVEQDSTTDQESDHQDSVTSKQWSSMSSPPTPRASSQPSTLRVHGPSSKTVQRGQAHSSSLTETTGSGPNKLPTRTHSGHPARPSDPSKGAPTPTHPQILTKTPPEPQLVDPVQTGPVKGSSARGKTLRSPFPSSLTNKHRLVEQDSTTDQESDHQDSVTSKQWSSMSSPPTPRASSQPSTLRVHGPSSKTVQGGQSHSSRLTETTGSGPNKLQTRSSTLLSQDGLVSPGADSGFVGSESSRLAPAAAPSPVHQRAAESVSVRLKRSTASTQTRQAPAPSAAVPLPLPPHSGRPATEQRAGPQPTPEQPRRRRTQRRRTYFSSPERSASRTEEHSGSSDFGLQSDSTPPVSNAKQNDWYPGSVSTPPSRIPSSSSPSALHDHGLPLSASGSRQAAIRISAIQLLQNEVSRLRETLDVCLRNNNNVRAVPCAQENYTHQNTSTPLVRSGEVYSDASRGRLTAEEESTVRQSTRKRPNTQKHQPDILAGSELSTSQPQVSRRIQTSAVAQDGRRSNTNTVHSGTQPPRQHRGMYELKCEAVDEPDSRSCRAGLCPLCLTGTRGRPEKRPIGGSREPAPSPRYHQCHLCGYFEKLADKDTNYHRPQSPEAVLRARYYTAAAPPAALHCTPLLLYRSPLYVTPTTNSPDPRSSRAEAGGAGREARGSPRRSLSAGRQLSVDRSLNTAIRAARHMKHTSRHMARSLATGLNYQELLTQSCSR